MRFLSNDRARINMKKKVALITTVFDEGQSIISFLGSIKHQTKQPNEIIIVDAKSKDETVDLIDKFQQQNPLMVIKLFIREGNRSAGRNEAIQKSSSELIAATDAGCILDSKWLESITKPFEKIVNIDIVSGWYQPDAKTFFEDCLGYYSIPPLTKINPNEFLPSARSICFRKSAWESIGGFNENMTLSEDTDFNLRLKGAGFKFVFEPRAKVYWRPRKNFIQLFRQSFSYNYSDAQKNILIYQKRLIVAAVFIIIMTTLLMLIDHKLIVVPMALILVFLLHKSYYKKLSSVIIIPLIKIITISGALTGFCAGKFSKITRLIK